MIQEHDTIWLQAKRYVAFRNPLLVINVTTNNANEGYESDNSITYIKN